MALLRRALGTTTPASAAQAEAAFSALCTLSQVAMAQQPDPLGGLLRGMLARAAACPPDTLVPLDTDARAYLNLLLRSFLLGRSFAPYGSVAAGLGLFLFNVRVARGAADSGAVADIGRALAMWTRFSLNASVRPLMRHAAPALLDLYQHADA